MNKELIKSLSNQAIENISNKRRLSDGQIERTWLQDDFEQEFARLIVEEVLNSALLFCDGFTDDYQTGFIDAQVQIRNAIKIKFGLEE